MRLSLKNHEKRLSTKIYRQTQQFGLESMTLSFTILATVLSLRLNKIEEKTKIENALNGNCVQQFTINRQLSSIDCFQRLLELTSHNTILLTKKPTASESCMFSTCSLQESEDEEEEEGKKQQPNGFAMQTIYNLQSIDTNTLRANFSFGRWQRLTFSDVPVFISFSSNYSSLSVAFSVSVSVSLFVCMCFFWWNSVHWRIFLYFHCLNCYCDYNEKHFTITWSRVLNQQQSF